MANWLERNPTPAIVSYTLLVAGATWAISTFILKDNRLNLAKSELSAQSAVAEQYASKNDLLQDEISALRSENAEYRQWLGQTKDAIPAVMPRIVELKESVAALQAEAVRLRVENPQQDAVEVEEKSATRGSAYIDDVTGLIFTVKSVSPDQMAAVLIHFPESGSPDEFTITPGFLRKFKVGNAQYRLTVTYINFIGDTVRFRLERIADATQAAATTSPAPVQ